jgi:1,4-alpha-glucan branching enzyme
MVLGYFGLVLHGHIPWCKKSGVWPAGEEWLMEAMAESYIPFLNIMRALKNEGIKTAVTINITPILAEQLADEYMKQRFSEYMDNLIARAQNDISRFNNQPIKKEIAEFHLNRLKQVLDTFYHNYYRDLLGTFKWLQEEGMIELITCAATHGFLPLFESDSGIFSQIQTAVDTHKKYFGRHPKGIWLPECAYRPKEFRNGKVRESLDYWLNNSGIEYFFVDTHGILDAELLEEKNSFGLTAKCGYNLETGVSVFGRNKKTSRQVWDSEIGYPGDESYREFHKKDNESGLHYWRITEKDVDKEHKELYDSKIAQEKVESHSLHFVSIVAEELKKFSEEFNTKGIIVSPYDFELYGHWWMEGIDWLKAIFKLINKNENVEMITFSEYISKYKDQFSTIKMGKSSWGKGGYFEVWQNPEHGWIWPYINSSIKDFENILADTSNPGNWGIDILEQTARELLLMEGSDWPFLLYTKQAKEYANKRFHHHHQRFNKLIWQAKNLNERNRISKEELMYIKDIDSCFQDLNIEYFRKR